jgi:hypothetical protein
MPFAALLPFVIVGIVIAVLRNGAEQKKRAEAQRRQAQMQAETPESGEGQARYTPVKPSVQAPPVRKAPEPRPVPNMQTPFRSQMAKPEKQMHAGHDFCALRPDPPKGKTHPEHEMCALRPDESGASETAHAHAADRTQANSGTILDFTPDNIVRGVLFSEIFGRPKALR